MVGGCDPFYLKFWAKLTPFGAKSPIFSRYSLVAPQRQLITVDRKIWYTSNNNNKLFIIIIIIIIILSLHIKQNMRPYIQYLFKKQKIN